MTTWPVVVAQVAARAYLAFLLTLAVVAVAPAAAGWQEFVVDSGSMTPRIGVGDVVVGRPLSADEQVEPGRVFVFEDPARPDEQRLLVHRVVERDRSGGWVTKGDANASADVEPVPQESFRARARILVPLVGLPSYWLRAGDVRALAAWAALTVAALLALARSRPGPRRRRPRRVLGVLAGGGVVVLVVTVAASAISTGAFAGFTATTRNPGSSWALSAATQQRYSAAVVDDNPYVYYLLDEAGGSTAADASEHGRPGLLGDVAAYRASGALPNNFGYAMGLGRDGRVVSGGSSLSDPTTFTLELWFRTTSRAGGKLIGFESGQGDWSLLYDRHVTMRTDGRLVYGDWNAGQIRTITSAAAYNDGRWHHLALTAVPSGNQQQSAMYVDGAVVAAGTTSRTSSYSGWWRVGRGKVRTSLGLTSESGFDGAVDQVAIYRTALSAARVQAHFSAR